MDFSEALLTVKSGDRVRRRLWAGTLYGNYLTLITPLDQAGCIFAPQLMVRCPDGMTRPFAGASWDLLADDWEIVND